MIIMASTMKRTAPASDLLRHIPENDRTRIIKSMIVSLHPGDPSGTEFVASLLDQHPDPGAKHDFLAFLESTICDGDVQVAVSIGLKFPGLGSELLHKAAEAASSAKSVREGSLNSYLSFTKSTISRLPISGAHSTTFEACLELLATGSKEVAMAAKDVVFAILLAKDSALLDEVVLPSQLFVWSCTKNLVTSTTDKLQSLLGYSLWLRWVLCVNERSLQDFITDEYWDLLVQGLRRGDQERRKLCLNILKITIAADSTVVSNEIREQYYRYCTVFETIVLGRYINQIQECEKDLDFLVSGSLVRPKWLYALLVSGLGVEMQDSNRKFVGNWVMQSGLQPSDEFMQFFKESFLPWAVQGRLFVASLKKKDGEMRCVHGDRLSKFVKRLLGTCSQPQLLNEIILEAVCRKTNSLFAYATVYLLDGLKGTLTSEQMERISEVSTLPEVARDFVNLQTHKTTSERLEERSRSKREVLEQQAIDKSNAFNPGIDDPESIWESLEILEYPKRLLMVMPKVILHPTLIRKAVGDPTLATDLASKLEVLLKIAQTKTFLFSPIVVELRCAIAIDPQVAEAFKVPELIIEIIEHPPAPTIDLMLEEATTHLTPFEYEHYFGKRTSFGFAALLDLVSRLGCCRDTIDQILHHLLQRWKQQKVPPPTVSTWKTTLQLQVLLLCFEQFTPSSEAQVPMFLDDLFRILAIEPLPRYRYLLEWIIIRLVVKFNLTDILCERFAIKDHHSNPKHLASLMKIGTILACRKASDGKFALQLATAFVPLAASSKIVIRHEAQWQIPLLMHHARSQNWTSIIENPAFATLDDYIRSMERFHEPPLERQIGRFDPARDHTLTNLVEGSWFNLDQIESTVTSRADFVELYNADADLHMPESCMALGGSIDRPAITDNVLEDQTNGVSLGPKTLDEPSALQTKGTAYIARALSDPGSRHPRTNDVVVVASLVENPYNLGGLSRVSEIFGAAALCLQNQNVVSNKDFTSVSVSSHLHFPIVQLSASNIPEYLAERKAEGFIVVGIEQTDRSVVLGSEDTRIPEKVVLVVGGEREGIPAVVLTECDVLVEIPQHGITRSLNVQTAVGIVLYEHARQHRRTQ